MGGKILNHWKANHSTEVCFASLLSGGFTTMMVINPQDWNLANQTFVRSLKGCCVPLNLQKEAVVLGKEIEDINKNKSFDNRISKYF